MSYLGLGGLGGGRGVEISLIGIYFAVSGQFGLVKRENSGSWE